MDILIQRIRQYTYHHGVIKVLNEFLQDHSHPAVVPGPDTNEMMDQRKSPWIERGKMGSRIHNECIREMTKDINARIVVAEGHLFAIDPRPDGGSPAVDLAVAFSKLDVDQIGHPYIKFLASTDGAREMSQLHKTSQQFRYMFLKHRAELEELYRMSRAKTADHPRPTTMSETS